MRRVGRFLVFVVFLVAFLGESQSVYAANIDNCSVLGTQGETYILTQDVIDSPNTTCINVTADDVVLDCQGKRIDGVDSGSTYGVLMDGRDNITVKDCNITDWWFGIYMNSSSNSSLVNNNLASNNDGVELLSSSENSINNNFIQSSQEGIYMDDAAYNSIVDNVINGGETGLALYSSSNNNDFFRNNYSSFSSYGIYIWQSYNNFFRDSVIETSSTNIYHFAAIETVFLNVSMDESQITVDAGTVYVKWYLDVRALTEEASPLNQANVTSWDKYNNSVFSNLTDSAGYTETQIVTEFHHNFSGKFYYSNYTINVTRFGFLPNQERVNMTGNKLVSITLERVAAPSMVLKTYDMGLAEKDIFKPGRIVRVRAEVTYILGREYLSNATILIKNNAGTTMVNNELMTNVSQITNGYVYEYNYTLPGTATGLWPINVTLTDVFDGKVVSSKKIAVIPVTLQIKLVLNSTSDRIYVPGTGELTFSGLTTKTYSAPPHYYIASYSGNSLKSVVFSQTDSLALLTFKGTGLFGIGTDQKFSNSQVFLVFSKGNWRSVDTRMSSVESGEFLSNPKPSFGYGLGREQPLKIVLDYDNIDINRSMNLWRGYNKIMIEKKGLIGGKINIDIRRV